MNQVFVWIDHGAVTVYSADTPEQLQGILTSVYAVLVQSLYDEDSERARNIYEKEKNKNTKKLVSNLIREFGVDWEAFEHGTGFHAVKKT